MSRLPDTDLPAPHDADASGPETSRPEPSGPETSGPEGLAAEASSDARPGPRSFTTSRPVAVLVVAIATAVFGWFSLAQLPLALMPELSYPTLTVRTEYPGAAPEEVENDISRPIEEALGVIGGLRRVSSVSRAGISDVILEFSWDTDMSEASQETLEKLDLVFLPDEAERPLILRYDPSLDPVMELSLSGSGDRFAGEEGLRRLRRLAELQVKRALEPVKGVAAVRVRGGLEEEIHVRIDEERLRRTGLPVDAVIGRLAQENVNVAGGTIQEGRTEYMVRTLNEYEDLDQIRDTVLTSIAGREVRIRDVAEVEWSHKEREILTRTDGHLSVQVDIYKEADANIVDLARRVEERLGELDLAKEEARARGEEVVAEKRPAFGPPRPAGEEAGGLATQLYRGEGAVLEVVADRSIFIQSSIDEVKGAAIFGGLFAVGVLFLFLRNIKSTLIVAVSIPLSVLITFAPLKIFGVSLNIMSLGGLALGIGMLVDSSIVVLESIFRCREEGDGVVSAAVRGTSEVRGAVVASTLTSIAVFFPMVFVEGIAGQAFGDLGLAVVVSLLASLAVAITFIPMLASRRGISRTVVEVVPEEKRGFRFTSFAAAAADFRALGRWLARPRSPVLRVLLLPVKLLLALPILVYLALRAIVAPIVELLVMAVLALLNGCLRLGRWFVRGLSAIGRPFGRLFAPMARAGGGGLATLGRIYENAVRHAVAHAGIMGALVVAILAVTAWTALRLDSELLPAVHQGEITFEVALPVGTPLEENEGILAPVEQAILAEKEHIRSLILTVGFDAENSQRSDEGEHTARFKVLLDSSDPQVEDAVVERIRRKLAEIPDLDARVTRPVLFSSKTPIEVEVYGDDLPRLKAMTDEVREAMAAVPGLTDVEATLKSGAPEVEIVYDRDLLSLYGLNIRQVATLVRDQVKGFEATRFNLKDRRIPVLVRLGLSDRETVADVQNLLVNPGAPRPIPLSAVANITLGEGPSEVRRIDGRRVAVVGANIGAGSLGSAVAAIDESLSRRIEWPANMTYLIAGQNEEWERSRGSLFLALGLSIFLVYVIMAAQFESLLQPLVILFTIPLAFFGSVLALYFLGISLSVVVFLGAIMLAGIVVNNAIVLVDYINLLRGRGLSREEAIVTAGSVRLRPILMTTATTVLGLLPMALGVGDGAEIRTPMAITVIAGLITSTALTLLVIPAIYALFDRASERLLGRSTVTVEAGATVSTRPPTPATEPALG